MKKKCKLGFLCLVGSKMWLIMKLTVVMLIIFCLQATGASYSQSQKISMQLEETALVDLFEKLEVETEYRFIYYSPDIKDKLSVSGVFKDASIKDVLDKCLENTGLSYGIDGNHIIIKPAPPKPVIPQKPKTITITGKVTDENGEPLPYVNIYIKGDTQGVITDPKGNYSISVEQKEDMVLVASFIGFVTKEFEVAGRTTINLMLSADIADLDEVVVTGYQTISTERATGSFENVKVESVLEQRTATNVMSVLEGEVNGLLFDQTANGSAPEISLRGITSFEDGENQNMPLLVIDGFPVNNGVSATEAASGVDNIYNIMGNMNPNDIESISVLKDAAAASIWGARAANGVIVITTKRGKKSDKPNFTFTSALSIAEAPDYSDAYYASGSEMLELDKWLFDNSTSAVSAPVLDDESGRRLYSKGKDLYYNYANGLISEGEFNTIENNLKQNDIVKEYSDLFLRNYTQQQYTLSVSQGSDVFNYYASLNYTDEKSFNKGTGNQSYQTLINLSAEIVKGVKLSTKINYSVRDIENNGADALSNLAPYERILDINGDYVPMNASGPRAFAKDDVVARMGDIPYDWDYNVKRDFDNYDNTTEVRNSDIQVKLDVDILKGLKAELSYNHRYGSREVSDYQNEEIFLNRDRYFQYAKFDSDGNFTGETGYPTGGTLEGSYQSTSSSDYRALLNYSGYLDNSNEHFITAIAGIDYKEDKMNLRDLEKLYGYDPNVLTNSPMDLFQEDYHTWYGEDTRFEGDVSAAVKKDENRYLSNYFNLGYTFKERYNLTGSWRLDDSNLFGSSDKYRNVPLWSVGAKWRMAEENFLNIPFLNRLDLRLSYGTGGRINRSTSPFLTFKRLSNPDFLTNVNYARIQDRRNPELRWETTTTLNAGFDFAMLNNRLSGSFEYYNRYTKDLMGTNPINPTYGVPSLQMNYGEISNKGFDVNLNYRLIQAKDLSWNIGLLMSHNVNKVEEYNGQDYTTRYLSGSTDNVVQGYAIDEVYSYRWAGLSPVDGSPQLYVLDRNPDDAAVDDDDQYDIIGINDTDVEITKEDLMYIGHLTPKYYGSLSNSFRYKGLTLDLLLTYKLGHKFRTTSIYPNSQISNYTSSFIHEDAMDRWEKPGDENTTNVPAFTTSSNQNADNFYANSDIMYEDASHIRIQSIGLSYQLDKKILDKTFIKGVTVGANARNLGLLWKATDKDIDPEINNAPGTYRNRATYSLSLKLNF